MNYQITPTEVKYYITTNDVRFKTVIRTCYAGHEFYTAPLTHIATKP